MQLKICLFLFQFILLHPDNYINAKALVGQSVQQIQTDEYLYIALIRTVIGESYHITHDVACTGTLITPVYVLTTESCLKNRSPVQIQVFLGSTDINNCTRYFTSWWVAYDTWALYNNIMVTTHGHEVTMLRLETEVLDVQPAVIATVRKEDLFGLRVDLAGWPQPSLTRSFNIKEKANIKIISDDVCVQKLRVFNRRPNFQDNLFCTFADPYVLMSNVNSGGPVLHDNKIIGVNKKTYPATEPDIDPRKVNLHFNLGYYLGFIHDIISKC